MKRPMFSMPGKNMFLQFAFAITIYLLLLLCGCAITAVLVGSESISFESRKYGTIITLLISGFTLTKLLCREENKRGFLVAAAATIGAILMLSLGNLVLCADDFGGFIPTVLLTACGSVCALIIKGKKRRSSYRKKYT